MKFDRLQKILTGRTVKEWYSSLVEGEATCCHLLYASTKNWDYSVCMGWKRVIVETDEPGYWVQCGSSKFMARRTREEDRIFWKIGRQSPDNVMQCDLDIDFDMPYVTKQMAESNPELTEGDVDNTESEITVKYRNSGVPYGSPEGYRSWDSLAARMRKTARRVFMDWKDEDGDDET